MVTFFHHPALLHHHDPVGAADSRETVGDDQRGAAMARLLQRFLHQAFIVGVER